MDIIAIIGISGAGKSTLGQIVANTIGYDYLDLDSFYLPTKPKVDIVINDKVVKVSNWDTLDAVDIDGFRQALVNRTKPIIVTGFVLPDSIYTTQTGKPTITIWLRTGFDPYIVINRAIEARLQSKQFTINKAAIDRIMVCDYVYSFFMTNLESTTITNTIDVYGRDQRRTVNSLVDQILSIILLH